MAREYPVECVSVGRGDDDVPRAVLYLDSNLDRSGKEEILRSCPSLGKGVRRLSGPDDVLPAISTSGTLKNMVNTELAKVKKSRLPCGLLLLKITGVDGRADLQKNEAVIRNSLPQPEQLAHYGETTFAVLLPGLGIRQARCEAQRIYEKVREHVDCREKEMSVSAGMTVCVARHIPGAATFIDMAASQLQRAEQEGPGIYWEDQKEKENSCQVTAEERAHLFSFLTEGGKDQP